MIRQVLTFEQFRNRILESESLSSKTSLPKRNQDFTFEVNKTKNVIVGIIATLSPMASEESRMLFDNVQKVANSLSKNIDEKKRLDQLVKNNELAIRDSFNLVFDKSDYILTRQIEYNNLVVQIGKESIATPKENIDYQGIVDALKEMYVANEEVSSKIQELLKDPKFLTITTSQSRIGSLNPNANRMSKTVSLEEGMRDMFNSGFDWLQRKVLELRRMFRRYDTIFKSLDDSLNVDHVAKLYQSERF